MRAVIVDVVRVIALAWCAVVLGCALGSWLIGFEPVRNGMLFVFYCQLVVLHALGLV
jgi:hypothetical protein